MGKSNIKWDASKEDAKLIDLISERACKMFEGCVFINIQMDITACHLNGTPLMLKELLTANDFNFSHDMCGISKNICRKTAKLKNHFLPRFSA